MKNRLANNAATIAFVLFLILGAGYSLYTVIWKGPSQAARSVNHNVRVSCEKNKVRGVIFQQFALEAAAARRRNADHLSDQNDQIGALNEIATAKRYEGFAKDYAIATPQNCEDAFPDP